MRSKNHPEIAVIIPTLNEEESLGPTLSELREAMYNPFIIVIDANSADDTIKIAKKFGAVTILQDGEGKGAALRQAFCDNCLNSDFVAIMDADGSMNPKEIPLLIMALESGADVVKGSRFLGTGYSTDISLIRNVGNKILLSLVNLLWSTHYTDLCYGFMAFRLEALEKIVPHLTSKHFEIETEICIKAKKLGLIVQEVPSIELPRRNGKSNLRTFVDGFRILRKILSELLRN